MYMSVPDTGQTRALLTHRYRVLPLCVVAPPLNQDDPLLPLLALLAEPALVPPPATAMAPVLAEEAEEELPEKLPDEALPPLEEEDEEPPEELPPPPPLP